MRIEVTVPRSDGRARHRAPSSSPAADEVTVRHGIPVTTVPRTLLDLAAVVPERQLERALNEAEVLRLTDELTLDDLLRRYPRRPGSRAVRAALRARRRAPPSRGASSRRCSSPSSIDPGWRRPEVNALRGGPRGRRRLAPRRAWWSSWTAVRRTARRARSRPIRERDRVLQAQGWRVVRSPSVTCATRPEPGRRRPAPPAARLPFSPDDDQPRRPLDPRRPPLENRLVLAPLAGIGNWFVRLQARRFGAGLVVSEMVSSFGLAYGNERTVREFLRIHPRSTRSRSSCSATTPAIMREAAAMAADAGADLIDLNMGCPVRKVCKTGAGAALLDDHDQGGEHRQGGRARAAACPSPSSCGPATSPATARGVELARRLVSDAGVAGDRLPPPPRLPAARRHARLRPRPRAGRERCPCR